LPIPCESEVVFGSKKACSGGLKKSSIIGSAADRKVEPIDRRCFWGMGGSEKNRVVGILSK
jgi:hypothetical protein